MAKKTNLTLYAFPFMAFVVCGWLGLTQLVQNKREVQSAFKGLESVEEMDPLEKMRRHYGLDRASHNMTSLEEELESIKNKYDSNSFDYKPIPRDEDE
mmetsp:Transcript_19319/g.34894  ORF Transcript_19319/g.34894 Transcript_19319/m.34894 type:complete len:98 (+) Transcript_19319:60-353(+)